MKTEDRTVALTMLGVMLVLLFVLGVMVLNSENRAAQFKLERDYYHCLVEATSTEQEQQCFTERETAEVRLERSLL